MAFAAIVALLSVVGVVGASPASASSAASTKARGCAAQVVSDWYGHKDKKVHGHYPPYCYQEALDSLGSDVGDYTNAREAISQAAAAEALRCKSTCGPTSGGAESSKLQPGEKAAARHNTYDFGGNPPPETIDPIPTSTSPSSVPLPLIVLASLAALLLMAGAGSYIARRLKASRAAPPATDASS